MRPAFVAALALGVALAAGAHRGAPPAAAHEAPSRLDNENPLDSGLEVHAHEDEHAQRGKRPKKHLEATRKNVELVGTFKPRGLAPGRISDVGVHGNYAYLGAFREPDCEDGGVYVVDIRNPKRMRQVSFIEAAEDSFVGEGVQVIPLRTPAFQGDLLVYNNEICGQDPGAAGGVTLVDVSDPRSPRKLVDGFGDRTGSDAAAAAERAHQIHSAFAWQSGERAYVVTVDDEEGADVDIMDITDPRNPQLVSETDLDELGVEQRDVNGKTSFLHDVIVKRIGGVQTMLLSYWDGGYVQLNVNDPARPAMISQTDFTTPDPQRLGRGQRLIPEGNAHQAEFGHANRYFIAADEDFESHRLTAKIASGADAGRPIQALEGSPQSNSAADRNTAIDEDSARISTKRTLDGATAFLGQACDAAAVPKASATGATAALVERGTCTFTQKAEAASAAGYKGIVVFNQPGVEQGCDSLVNAAVEAKIPFIFIRRSDAFRVLGAYDPRSYRCTEGSAQPDEVSGPVGDSTPLPQTGARGAKVLARSIFDGWGYVHLYDRRTLEEVDTYAIPESQQKRYASNYGDLSVHEVAMDPDTNLAYFSYYAGGFRVARYGRDGIREVGRYIARGGNNFWGVQVLERGGRNYVLASDRDRGLWMFRYTGP